MSSDLIERLLKRAEIRRKIMTRKSVQEGKPDRIADLLEEAAKELLKRSSLNEEHCQDYGRCNCVSRCDFGHKI